DSRSVGALPDMLTFTPDGKYVLVANEGEPNDDYSVDPEGSISIVEVLAESNRFGSVRTAGFESFNEQRQALLDAGVRIYGPADNTRLMAITTWRALLVTWSRSTSPFPLIAAPPG